MPEIPNADNPERRATDGRGQPDGEVPTRNVIRDMQQARRGQIQETSSSDQGERALQTIRREKWGDQRKSAPTGGYVSGSDVLAALHERDKHEARRARREEEPAGPPSPEVIQRLRAAQAAAEQGSSTPADVPLTPQAQPESPPASANTERQHLELRPPIGDNIDTTAIDRDVASFARRVGRNDVADLLRER